jgi:cytoskeletal protein RodZ
MAKGNFGEHLKREREMRGVSLEEISAATRISTRFLEALENEQWERLPGGIFNRGFVRAVARYLGLDEEGLVAEYAEATNDRPSVAVWVDTAPPPPRRYRGLWASLLLIVVIAAGAWLAYRYYGPLIAAWRAPVPAAPVKTSPPLPPPAAAPAKTSEPAAEVMPAAPQETLELKISAGRPTYVTVIADGKTVLDRQIKSGEQERIQAKESFEVVVGNSSAVLLELNGQTVPPLAAPGEPGRVTLTHKDLKRLRSSQN